MTTFPTILSITLTVKPVCDLVCVLNLASTVHFGTNEA